MGLAAAAAMESGTDSHSWEEDAMIGCWCAGYQVGAAPPRGVLAESRWRKIATAHRFSKQLWAVVIVCVHWWIGER